MQRCSRFESCDIARCPLDYFMDERVEHKEDEVCVLRKLQGKVRTRRMKGILTPKMRSLANFVYKKNFKINQGANN